MRIVVIIKRLPVHKALQVVGLHLYLRQRAL